MGNTQGTESQAEKEAPMQGVEGTEKGKQKTVSQASQPGRKLATETVP